LPRRALKFLGGLACCRPRIQGRRHAVPPTISRALICVKSPTAQSG
jgi:hypothetical protein